MKLFSVRIKTNPIYLVIGFFFTANEESSGNQIHSDSENSFEDPVNSVEDPESAVVESENSASHKIIMHQNILLSPGNKTILYHSI